jgi:hypothetical protein
MSYQPLTINDLEEISPDSKQTETVIKILLIAINDWPNPIQNLAEYEEEVKSFLQGTANEERIRHTLKSINLSKSPWEGESLSLLLDTFQFYPPGISLNQMFEELEEILRNKD